MKIRSKLAWTYIILLIIGIIAISAYSILTIRSYLLEEGIKRFERDALSTALAVGSFQNDDQFSEKIMRLAELSGYEIAVYDGDGIQMFYYPEQDTSEEAQYLDVYLKEQIDLQKSTPIIENKESASNLVAYVDLPQSGNSAHYLRIRQDKAQYYEAVISIRHIIYAGMFFSIGAVIIVSFLFARYISGPILQLNRAALDIARGNLDRKIDLNRNDEFGTLADSLNHMAGTLRADNEKLKRLNERQSQFFADITHEVRNPLHAISGALEMLELDNLEVDKKKQYMKMAQKQIKRITRLFEDIKTLQRYDFDENFINKKTFDIKNLIEEVKTIYQAQAQKKGLELKLRKPQNCLVYADPDKIEQVLDNLTSNAIKYTPEGEVEIGFEVGDEYVEVYVKDTGPGIGKEHLDRLFDRFYRTDKARSRDKGGTGLGLSVVRGILSAHQTKINVESEVGKGSRFYFKLQKKDVD